MHYQPVTADDEMRLLDLLPGEDGESIRCTLRHARLSESPDYEAMSYVWGDATDTLPIGCNGHTLMVTRNLHTLMTNIQYKDRSRTIWADAACINQSDLSERSSQVRIMGSIYSRAKVVLAWLGETSPASDAAMALIVTLNAHGFEGTRALHPQVNDKVPDLADPAWFQLADLLRRNYFRRAWVGWSLGTG